MATHLVVDAMNVIGARPDGWWRDRDGAVRRLVGALGRLAAEGREVTVVVDGREIVGLEEGVHGGVEVLYAARGGRNAADDRIVELVRGHGEAGSLEVVTSDRELRGRVVALGAGVGSVRGLLEGAGGGGRRGSERREVGSGRGRAGWGRGFGAVEVVGVGPSAALRMTGRVIGMTAGALGMTAGVREAGRATAGAGLGSRRSRWAE